MRVRFPSFFLLLSFDPLFDRSVHDRISLSCVFSITQYDGKQVFYLQYFHIYVIYL
ncbi:hypothetical protein HMPREF3293_03117 [Christensenella minuta]|uniref:Uncharacterized protein n=1 Tax=Christensenella minuta TaxID=626937 RepID=A0A136Q049_9FIRM|nr:hypothetical protein HMPREF3293_03117 [Christensenella minuta]